MSSLRVHSEKSVRPGTFVCGFAHSAVSQWVLLTRLAFTLVSSDFSKMCGEQIRFPNWPLWLGQLWGHNEALKTMHVLPPMAPSKWT